MKSAISDPLQRTAGRRVVSIHQPHYFPWLGLVAKIACSDTFIFLDSVQFEKNGWQNRTRYTSPTGLKFLTLPVFQSGIVSMSTAIKDIELADKSAPQKHWRTLQQRYGKEPGWVRIADRLKAILTCNYDTLLPLALETTRLTLDLFNLRPKLVMASELSVSGTKSDRLINLVKSVSGTEYLSGAGAKEYIEPELFARAGIRLDFQEFKHPTYRQLGDGEFLPGALGLEWYLIDPDNAPTLFKQHLQQLSNQPPRCFSTS